VRYRLIRYAVLYALEVKEFVAVVLEQRPLDYFPNPSCVIRYYEDPAQMWPASVASFSPPARVQLLGAPLSAFRKWVEEEMQVIEDVVGGEARSWLGDVGRWLNALMMAIPRALTLIADGVRVFARGVAVIGESFRVLFDFVGRPGDPQALVYANMYRLQLASYTGSPVGEDVRAVLECRKPLSEVRGLLRGYREKDLNKTLCQIEGEAPKGIVGFISSSLHVLSAAKDIVALVVKHFVEINAAVIASILAFKAARAIERRNIDELVSGLKAVYRIFAFYYKLLAAAVNLILNAIHVVAQSATALKAVGDAVKSIIEKIVSAIKWLAALIASLI
jgi:hypothetical protein